jgi:hypothetical protein
MGQVRINLYKLIRIQKQSPNPTREYKTGLRLAVRKFYNHVRLKHRQIPYQLLQ